MDTRPTTNPDHVVKATRPGWIAILVFLAFVGGLLTFVSVVDI